MKRHQKERKATVPRLKADREHLRENIRCMERVLENLFLKRKKVYKCAHKHEQQNEEVTSAILFLNSIYFENEIIIIDES